MKKLGAIVIFVWVVILGMSGMASADPVTGYSTGSFNDLLGDVEYKTLYNNNTGVEWGISSTDTLSTLQAGKSSVPFGQTDINSLGILTDVKLGNLVWDNNDGSKKGLSVDWVLSLTLSDPNGGYTFADNSLAVTLHKAQGIDSIGLDNLSSVTIITIGGYTVSNIHYEVNDDGDLKPAGLTWTSHKGDVSTLWLMADFSAPAVPAVPAVPEPTTVLLLGLGLVGLAVFRRKSRG